MTKLMSPSYFILIEKEKLFKVISLKQANEMEKLPEFKKISKEDAISRKTTILELSEIEFDLKNNKNADFFFVESEHEEILVKQKNLEQDENVRKMCLSLKEGSNKKLTSLNIGEYKAYVEPLGKAMRLIVSDNVFFGEKTRVYYLEDYGFNCWKTVIS